MYNVIILYVDCRYDYKLRVVKYIIVIARLSKIHYYVPGIFIFTADMKKYIFLIEQ